MAKPDEGDRGASSPRFPFLRRGKGGPTREELVAANEELGRRYDSVLEASGEALVTTDGRYLILDWNQAAASLYGREKDEALGKPLTEVLEGKMADDRDWAASLPELLAQGPWQSELSLRGRGGIALQVSVKATAERDSAGAITFLTVAARDLGPERRLADKMESSEAEFQALASALPQLVWLGDEHGRTYWYNQRWYEYTGTTPEEMQGKGWQKVHDPAYLPGLLKRTAQAFLAGKAWEDVFPLRGKDGKYRLFYTRSVPVCNKEGKVVRWVGTNTDISELGEARAALKESESRRQGILDGMREGYILFEPATGIGGSVTDLRFVEVNRAFENITGTSRASISGQSFKTLFPEDAASSLGLFAQAAAGQPQDFVWESLHYGRKFSVHAYRTGTHFLTVLFRD